jgi:hypothetical protein
MSRIMLRPEQPPEAISKYTPTFQFPKSLLQPAMRVLIQMQDRGWVPGVPLKQHVVICGFPRSGTTLCQLMIESCVPQIKAFGRERRGLEIALFGLRTHSNVMTKRPKDVFLIKELREFYESHSARVRFLLLNRDPRSVLTSVHFSQPSRYFVSVDQWRHIFRHWKWASQASDVLSIRYEDLILDPDRVESQITAMTNWAVSQPFRQFHNSVPGKFDGRALNGLRELDPSNLDRWRHKAHRDRIRSLLSQMPELPDVLIELGYEADHSWTCEYLDRTVVVPTAA